MFDDILICVIFVLLCAKIHLFEEKQMKIIGYQHINMNLKLRKKTFS